MNVKLCISNYFYPNPFSYPSPIFLIHDQSPYFNSKKYTTRSTIVLSLTDYHNRLRYNKLVNPRSQGVQYENIYPRYSTESPDCTFLVANINAAPEVGTAGKSEARKSKRRVDRGAITSCPSTLVPDTFIAKGVSIIPRQGSRLHSPLTGRHVTS